MPFLPFMPDINAHLDAFKEQVWLSPHGEEATGPATLYGDPQLPETAGIDQTGLQRGAIQALAGIRNSADEMSLAAQQSQAIARNAKIAAARAYEALLSYERIYSRESRAAEAAAASPMGGKMPMSMLQVRATSFAPKLQDVFGNISSKEYKRQQKLVTRGHVKTWKDRDIEDVFPKKGKSRWRRGERDDIDIDNKWYLKNQLENSFKFCKEVSIDAADMAKSIAIMSQRVQSASRAVTEALKLPGAPVPPTIPPTMLKPPKRPRDLPPLWLDVPFATSKGGDPYALSVGFRNANGATLFEIPGFNPFEGEVPNQENGLSDFYGKVKLKSEGGTLYPGISFPDGGGLGDMAANQASGTAAGNFF